MDINKFKTYLESVTNSDPHFIDINDRFKLFSKILNKLSSIYPDMIDFNNVNNSFEGIMIIDNIMRFVNYKSDAEITDEMINQAFTNMSKSEVQVYKTGDCRNHKNNKFKLHIHNNFDSIDVVSEQFKLLLMTDDLNIVLFNDKTDKFMTNLFSYLEQNENMKILIQNSSSGIESNKFIVLKYDNKTSFYRNDDNVPEMISSNKDIKEFVGINSSIGVLISICRNIMKNKPYELFYKSLTLLSKPKLTYHKIDDIICIIGYYSSINDKKNIEKYMNIIFKKNKINEVHVLLDYFKNSNDFYHIEKCLLYLDLKKENIKPIIEKLSKFYEQTGLSELINKINYMEYMIQYKDVEEID